MKPTLSHYLHLHFIVLIFGFTAILGLLIPISPLALVFWRSGLAAAGLYIVLKQRGESFGEMAPLPADSTRPAFFSWRSVPVSLLAIGALLAVHWVLFFGAARVASASVCLAGMATTSLWTSLLDPLLSRRRLRWLEVGMGLVILLGLYVIFLFQFNQGLGLLMAVAASVLAAVFSILNARFVQRYSSITITFWEMLGACLTCGVALLLYTRSGLVTEPLRFWPTGVDWLWLALLAGVCTVYAYSVAVRLLRVFSAFTINLTVNLEPVYGILLAVLFFGDRERMTTGFYLGTLLVLGAVLLYPVLARTNKEVDVRP